MKVVYTAPERNSHHIYMALIIILILSEDDLFNKTIHNIVSFFNKLIFKTFLKFLFSHKLSLLKNNYGILSVLYLKSVSADY